ncbi:major capsid protein [Microviridae sp.]|nr:major capsid protein [Microviridae sp.]
MKSTSKSNAHFAIAPTANIQRSKFRRDHGYKTTFDAGPLVPIFVDEALPGDTFNLRASFFARLNTPVVPILDNMWLETFFFEVPVRQVWDNWEKFNGEQDNPGDSTDYLVPQCTSPVGGYAEESLQDYMGIPPLIENIKHSALFTRAYNHIWNTWFRDQNLQTSVVVDKDDGPDTTTDYKILNRGKRHDYFTSSLPWPQKGEAVSMPLGDKAYVQTDWQASQNNTMSSDSGGNHFSTDVSTQSAEFRLFANLEDATAATINALRQSVSVQRLLEKDARGGTRYIEVVYSHFGVRSPDLRLQRPGYLGGGRSSVNISPVAQTQSTDTGTTPLGELAAIGTVSGTGHGFTKSFTEHTIIIGLCNVRADLTYQQALNRMWSRRTRWDFYWPEFANLGEMAVLQQEIFAQGTEDDEDVVFGYQEAFGDMRYKPSLITGKMRSSSPTTLDYWHLSQDFATPPVLGPTFITEDPPVDRVVATPDEPHFKMDCYFNLTCARPMPMYGIPGLAKL